MNASELFVRCLEEEGVREVFGVPGEETLDLMEALRKSTIRFVPTRHEQHAAFLAAAHGRLTGRAGVCLSTLGPGATNLVTGVAYAQLGGMPLIAITGQKPLRGNLEGNFQLVDVVSMFRPLTKWATAIASPDRIPRSVRYAFKTAEGERPGAVHLELPEDVAREDANGFEPQSRTPPRRPLAGNDALDQAAAILREARQPVLLVSAGASRKRVGPELTKLLEDTGLFALTTQMGKGVVPEDHPQSLFALGIHKKDYAHAALERADVVATIGYDIVEYPPAVWNAARDKRLIHVDFRVAEPDAYYAPEVEVVGDLAASLDALRERLAGALAPQPALARLRAEIEKRLFDTACSTCWPHTPQRVVYDVREVLDREDFVSLDNGIFKVWFARMYRTYAENTLLLDNALATMGAGLAAAQAAKMAHPDRRALAVVGDGGFLMNLQDLETAVRMGQDLVILLLRDDAYGFIRWKQHDMGLPDFGMEFDNPDFVKLAESFGAKGLRVDYGDDLREVLRAAYDAGGVVLVDCPIDYGPNRELSADRTAEVAAMLEE
ncbi:MAG: acetolactate synthase large subunit [Planctomycetota bacterium]|nr:acetolactate synthase large subunit [Planctomycetota bacterium]